MQRIPNLRADLGKEHQRSLRQFRAMRQFQNSQSRQRSQLFQSTFTTNSTVHYLDRDKAGAAHQRKQPRVTQRRARVHMDLPQGRRIIQSTIDEVDIGKDYPVEDAILGDARLVLRQLIDEVQIQMRYYIQHRRNFI